MSGDNLEKMVLKAAALGLNVEVVINCDFETIRGIDPLNCLLHIENKQTDEVVLNEEFCCIEDLVLRLREIHRELKHERDSSQRKRRSRSSGMFAEDDSYHDSNCDGNAFGHPFDVFDENAESNGSNTDG